MRKLLLLSMLSYGSICGLPMDPKEIEELLDVMNRPKAEITIPDHNDHGDPKRPGSGSEPQVKTGLREE